MYYDDHDPPHFHMWAANFQAKVALGDLSIIQSVGRIRAADILMVRNWAHRHRVELFENWGRMQRLERPNKIED